MGRKLEKKGIEVRSGFWPLNKLNNFNSKYIGSKNVSLEIFNKSLVLPSNISLNNKDILYFRNIIKKNI